MPRPGRPCWPNYLTANELRVVMDRLDALDHYVKLPNLCKVLGVARQTALRWLLDASISRVPPGLADGAKWSARRGHVRVYRAGSYYDPQNVTHALHRTLRGMGEHGAHLINVRPFDDPNKVTQASPVNTPTSSIITKPGTRNAYNRWTPEEIATRIAALRSAPQWLQPKDLAPLLGVAPGTLYIWRHHVARTGPPFHQRPNLVPSSQRFPDGRVRPRSNRTPRPSFNCRFDPVLYDRNEVLRWLKNIYLQRNRRMV